MNYKEAASKAIQSPNTSPLAHQVVPGVRVDVYLRKTDNDGLQRHPQVLASCCSDLVDFAGSKLGPSWDSFSEHPELLVLEASQGTQHVLIKRHDDPVLRGRVYTVLESWTKTPATLFRRVRLDDAVVTTYTFPGKKSPFTNLSPLGCAALRESEHQVPWYSALPNGSIKIHGISLDMTDDATQLVEPVDPLEPIPKGSKEQKGITSMSLDQ